MRCQSSKGGEGEIMEFPLSWCEDYNNEHLTQSLPKLGILPLLFIAKASGYRR